MKVFYDTSVLVTALVDQLPNHEAALACLAGAAGSRVAFSSTHCMADCYAALTALPLPRRVQPADARQLLWGNVTEALTVIELPERAYHGAIERASNLGLVGGAVHDALNLGCAEEACCERLYTYLINDYERLHPVGLSLATP